MNNTESNSENIGVGRVALGMDIGGTKIIGGIVRPDGHVITWRTAPTPMSEGIHAVLSAAAELAQRLQQEAAAHQLEVITAGVASAGQVDPDQGIITFATKHLQGWTGAPIAAHMSAALGFDVAVENDIRAMAIGEGRYGLGSNYDRVIYLAVGTGIGGAIVQDGRIWTGAHFSAGEIGYLVAEWRGSKPVYIEELYSGPGLAREYSLRSGMASTITLQCVKELADAGDPLAQRVIRDGAYRLGTILSPVLTFYDPQVVIVGGGVTKVGPLWWEAFVAGVHSNPLPAARELSLHLARLRSHAVLIGAAVNAMERAGL